VIIDSFHILLICDWLNMKELGKLDMAMSNHGAREAWLNVLKTARSQAASKWLHSHRSMRWVYDLTSL
jgi:hypothetical protein